MLSYWDLHNMQRLMLCVTLKMRVWKLPIPEKNYFEWLGNTVQMQGNLYNYYSNLLILPQIRCTNFLHTILTTACAIKSSIFNPFLLSCIIVSAFSWRHQKLLGRNHHLRQLFLLKHFILTITLKLTILEARATFVFIYSLI